ncbi:VOC family protein [Yoonia sp. SS1-5]|uniref:VOC family protein n=1 Tax=Yoonia rhodophyticola TaxID=3137370 RepID=A0AAN0M992_9RHOB
MKSTQYYPLIQTDDVAGTVAFYQRHLGFQPLFESDWYVHLQSRDDEGVNLAVIDAQHETIHETARGPSRGVILTFEVEDVDAVHTRLTETGAEILQPLRDEPHGQRHFVTRDPNGLLIDIITPIPPSAEFVAGYDESVLPQ